MCGNTPRPCDTYASVQWAIIGFHSGLSPIRLQAIISNSAGLFFIWKKLPWDLDRNVAKTCFPFEFSSYLVFHILCNDDVIKWKHFPRYWPFVRGIHRWPVYSAQKRPMTQSPDVFFHINGWVKNREAGDLRRHHVHYDVTVMFSYQLPQVMWCEGGLTWPTTVNRNRIPGKILIVLYWWCVGDQHPVYERVMTTTAPDQHCKCYFA